jgi:hypothetical protein
MHGVTQAQFNLARPLGIRLIRRTLYWSYIEKTDQPGAYDADGLATWDDIVRRAATTGVELVVVVHGNPPGVGWENRDESYERFAQFMEFAARRWPAVRYWELWNEMDVGCTDLFGAGGEGLAPFERGRRYARMLQHAYPALKRGNPKAWVLLGGVATVGEFIRGVYEEGGRDFFDFMNIHTYGVPLDWPVLCRGTIARNIMARYGDSNRPMWNTEFGIDAGSIFAASGATTGEQFDAGNERGLDMSRVTLPEGRQIDDYGFGLTRRDGTTPRPTYDWLLEAQVNRPIQK